MNKNFLENHQILNTLKEIVNPNDIDTSSIRMNDTLNPLIWDNEKKLKPEIRKLLLLNAKRFIEFSDFENLKFDDIILTGSMANYNYNENSDLDVHIILNYNQISTYTEFAEDYLKMKKEL